MIKVDRIWMKQQRRIAPRIFEEGCCGEFAYALQRIFGYSAYQLDTRRRRGVICQVTTHVVGVIDEETVVDWRGVQSLAAMRRRWGTTHIFHATHLNRRFLDPWWINRAVEFIAQNPMRFIP